MVKYKRKKTNNWGMALVWVRRSEVFYTGIWNAGSTFGVCLWKTYAKGIPLPPPSADEWLLRMHTKLIPQLSACTQAAAPATASCPGQSVSTSNLRRADEPPSKARCCTSKERTSELRTALHWTASPEPHSCWLHVAESLSCWTTLAKKWA